MDHDYRGEAEALRDPLMLDANRCFRLAWSSSTIAQRPLPNSSGGCSKTLVLFFISRVRSTVFRDQFLGARKTRESAAKGQRKVLICT